VGDAGPGIALVLLCFRPDKLMRQRNRRELSCCWKFVPAASNSSEAPFVQAGSLRQELVLSGNYSLAFIRFRVTPYTPHIFWVFASVGETV